MNIDFLSIAEKTARCWAEIDLDEIIGNYLRATEIAFPAKVICVLKADAYGMGAKVVGPALAAWGADWFAVADGDEAEELMSVCPKANVLVLGLVGEIQIPRLIKAGAVFTCYSRSFAETLIEAAKRVGKPARVHIKLETGLHRLGFSGDGAIDEIEEICRSKWIKAEGLFTHLALHTPELDKKQFELFDNIENALQAHGIVFDMVHICDSIGMVRYPERRRDAVRTGAWLYGVTPGGCPYPEMCRPVARLRARIAQIHDIRKGELIGYDDDHPLGRDSRVATLSVGYVDGVPRYNNVGFVEIRGHRAPVMGLVCMDQMMVDITDIPDAGEGDAVTLLGDGITIPEYAQWGRLNRNESLTRFGKRVPKIYIQKKYVK